MAKSKIPLVVSRSRSTVCDVTSGKHSVHKKAINADVQTNAAIINYCQ